MSDYKLRNLIAAAERAREGIITEVAYDPAKFTAVVGERFAEALDRAIEMNERLGAWIASNGKSEPDYPKFLEQLFGANVRLRDIWHLVRVPVSAGLEGNKQP